MASPFTTMHATIGHTTTSTTRRPRRPVVALVVVSIVASACAGTDVSTPPSIADTPSTSTTTSTPSTSTTSTSTTSTSTIPLDEDDQVFKAGPATIVVANAPAPWEPFPVSSLGMRRDGGTAEWVGISFWDPDRVATDSCRWKDSWATPGESVAEFAEALVAIPGRRATTPVPVTVGGHEGLYLEWSLPADLDVATCDDATTVAWTGAGRRRTHDIAGLIDRIWILDIEGQRILIDALSFPVEQEIIRQRVDEVIDSLRFAVVA